MESTNKTMAVFLEKLGEVIDLRAANAVLQWDQEIHMPPKGAPARGRQLATLSALDHRLFTSPEMKRLIEDLQGDTTLDEDETAQVRETAYDLERATKLPEAFVETFAQERSKAYEAWVKARAESDFKLFQPHLEKIVELLRKKADYFGYADSPYDALLEDYERGMTARELRRIFGGLVKDQRALLQQIQAAPTPPESAWMEQEWDTEAQWALSLRVLGDMGYDFEAGRQDRSVHPFTTNFDLFDVRVTTRIDPRNPFSGLMGSIHEGGHALYEQGFDPKDQRTTLAQAPSLGIHESQSRLWEIMIGQSLPFWRHYTPVLQSTHAGQLDGLTPEEVYRRVNTVTPSCIRVEADECTYNLHIVLRFELELALIEGSLQVADLPEAWNEKMQHYLGLTPPDDAQGCLQDIHWSFGYMGYFPTYALGNLYAAQLIESIQETIPGLWEQIASGEFTALLAWLRENVHRHGRRLQTGEILRKATGKAPDASAYLAHLRTKYGKLYGFK